MGGCSGSEDDQASTASGSGAAESPREQYIAEADAICSRANEPYPELSEEAQSAIEEGDSQAYVRAIGSHLRNLEAGLKNLRQLPAPPESSKELDDFFLSYKSMIDAGFRATTTIERNGFTSEAEGPARVVESFGDLTREDAEDFGFEVCGQAPD